MSTARARLGLCAIAALAAHAGVAMALIGRAPPSEVAETAGAFAVEIATVAAASAEPVALPPGPPARQATAAAASPPTRSMPETPAKARPEPVAPTQPLPDLPKLPPLANGDVAQPAEPVVAPPQPMPAAVAVPAVSATSAPQVVAERPAVVAKATSIGAPNGAVRRAVSRWQTLVLDRIERQKRYPAAALAGRRQGTAMVRFSLDAEGRLLDAAIAESSGSDALDAEALALLRRAAPFPALPDGAGAELLSLAVPIRFKLR